MFNLFKPYPDLVTNLSQRSDGNMKLFEANPTGEHNRARFLVSLGLDGESWVRSENVHGKTVAVVNEAEKGTFITGADGLITTSRGLSLLAAVADCLPLYFFDAKQKIIGLAHAGWRGVYANIASEMIDQLVSQFHSQPADILVGIGVGIGPCHFTVKPDVAEKFAGYAVAHQQFAGYIKPDADGLIHVDLKGIVREQLLAKGITSEHIEIHPDCTYCQQEQYFSRRRDAPVLEAMISVISLKP